MSRILLIVVLALVGLQAYSLFILKTFDDRLQVLEQSENNYVPSGGARSKDSETEQRPTPTSLGIPPELKKELEQIKASIGDLTDSRFKELLAASTEYNTTAFTYLERASQVNARLIALLLGSLPFDQIDQETAREIETVRRLQDGLFALAETRERALVDWKAAYEGYLQPEPVGAAEGQEG